MKKLIYIILFINTYSAIAQVKTDKCKLFSEILVEEKIKNYLHTNLKNRSKLYVIKNELCNSNEIYKTFKIIIIDEKQILKRMNYIKIVSIKKNKKGQLISLDYPIEGAIFNVQIDCNNKIVSVEIIEK